MRSKHQLVAAAALAALAVAPGSSPYASSPALKAAVRAEVGRPGGGFNLLQVLGIPSRAGNRGGGITTSLNGRPHSGVAAAKRYARKVRSVRRRSPMRGPLKNRVARRA